MSIEQFTVWLSIERDEHGRWVRYDDYVAAVEEMETAIARLREENAQLQERVDVLSQNWPLDHEQPD